MTNRGVVALLAGVAVLVVRGTPAFADVEVEGHDVPPPGGIESPLGPDRDANFQVDASLWVTRYAIAYPGAPGASGTQENLSTTLIAFGAPLRDDDTPYSLQPFLQRENTFSFSLSGGHFDTAYSSGGPDRTEWVGGLGAAFNAYLKRWFALFGGASYDHFSLSNGGAAQTGHSFAANLGVGFRYRDTRLDLSGGEAVESMAGAVAPWRGSLTISLFTVIERRGSLTASGSLVHGGSEGSIEGEIHPTKATGVFASAFAGRFEPYTDPILVTRYVGSAGFVGWFDAATALVGQYSLTYEKAPATPYVTNGYDELAHSFLVKAYFRFP